MKNLEHLEISYCHPIKLFLDPLVKANLRLITLKIKDKEREYNQIESIMRSSKSSLKRLELNYFLDMMRNKSPLSKICSNLTHLSLKIFIKEGQRILFNYIDHLKDLKYLYLEISSTDNIILNDYYFENFNQIDLPCLQLISLKLQTYSLDSLEKCFNFSNNFNKINIYVSKELNHDQIS